MQLEIAPGSIDRAERCLIQIVAAAKAQGFELSAKASKAAFTNGSVAIPFAIKEGYKRIKHVLTPEEIAEDERRQRRRSRDLSIGAEPGTGIGVQWGTMEIGRNHAVG